MSEKKFKAESSVTFGGTTIETGEGTVKFRPEDDKVERIKTFPSPKTRSELKSFLADTLSRNHCGEPEFPNVANAVPINRSVKSVRNIQNEKYISRDLQDMAIKALNDGNYQAMISEV